MFLTEFPGKRSCAYNSFKKETSELNCLKTRFKKHLRMARYVVDKKTLIDFKDHF
jgi:hypothetical protein